MEGSVNIQTPAVSVKPARSQAEEDLLRFFKETASRLPGARNRDVARLRERAISGFSALGLPHRRIEEWKYTDLRARLSEVYPFTAPATEITETELRAALGALALLDAHVMVFVNGAHRPELSKFGPGIEAMPLNGALEERPGWFDGLLGKVNTPERDPVYALNTAFMSTGAAIRIAGANGGNIKPVHLVFVSSGESPASAAYRNVVLVGKGANATLIEHHLSLGAAPWQVYAVTELALEDGARVEHIKVQDESLNTTHLASWVLRLGRDAQYQGIQLNTGAALARNQIFLRFAGEGTQANVSAAVLGRGRQHCDITMVIDHAVPGCQSRELVKSVLEDQARSVFQGKVIVQPGAQKTDGKQMAQALLLSDGAEFDSKPELEIYADDVACGHGSTSGHLNEDLLFYLRSRGISEHEARALLIAAFVDEVLDRASGGVREALTERTAAWLRRAQLSNA